MTVMQTPPDDPEMLLLRSIEWTTFAPETFETALEQANVILRYFLGEYLPFLHFPDVFPLSRLRSFTN